MSIRRRLGANYLGRGECSFRVWAPHRTQVDVLLFGPELRVVPMESAPGGYWTAKVEDTAPGMRYLYRLDRALERPDPASRHQPEGVHGPSAIVETDHAWRDPRWHGIPRRRHVLYELHVGTFTDAGTFDGAIRYLDDLRDLGVTTVELMPLGQFPGGRNWGYDGVYPFAVQESYGGPEGLRRFVEAAHERDLAVVLDLVCNHAGPEGNYLGDFGPYFTDAWKTPWGRAINMDGPYSDGVRQFFLEAALSALRDYRLDGLRLDATHFIFDSSARHFLAELSAEVARLATSENRHIHLFAESDNNDIRWLRPESAGGFGMDVHWNDDFQHALLSMLPGADARAYREDYGDTAQFARALGEGFVYNGCPSPFRRRRHGTSSAALGGDRLLVFLQNHDQVGNRPLGDRLASQVDFETLKVAAAAMLLAPAIPLLFMGEEYAETAPFFYFVSHSDPALIEAVRNGRREEFAHFLGNEEPPDPQAEDTFERSRLSHRLKFQSPHRELLDFHRELLRLRREHPALVNLEAGSFRVEHAAERLFILHRSDAEDRAVVLISLSQEPCSAALSLAPGTWHVALTSKSERWLGPGSDLAGEYAVDSAPLVLPVAPISAMVLLRASVG